MTTNISFNARFIAPATIKRTKSKDYNKCIASFVNIDHANINDINSIKLLNDHWGANAKYLKPIFYDLHNSYKTNPKNPICKVYALTTQLSELENLNPKEIQGVVEIIPTMTSDLFITYLQIDPKNDHDNPDRIFSKVGTEILNTIKKLFPQKKLITIAGNNSQDFYNKNGFVKNKFGLLEYIPENNS